MKNDYISNPRPIFDNTILEHKDKAGRLLMGSKSNGIIFDITQKGIEVNGYYEGFSNGVKYANLRKSIFIPWKEIDKIKQKIRSFGKKDKIEPDFVDESPSKEYLATLPIVHINDKEYYIDSSRKERRLVDRPCNVYKF